MTSLQILQYSLYNDDNYKSILNVTINDIISKYNLVIIEYFKLKITGVREIIRGLDTISHVFEIMILYTKNLDMTYYHSQKAFYFYGEFINQIIEDPNNLLQLTAKDATLFVYKKTIFDLKPKNISILSADDIVKLDILNLYINIIKNICENRVPIYLNLIIQHLSNSLFDKEMYEIILLFIQNVSKEEDIILSFIKILHNPVDRKILKKNIENSYLLDNDIQTILIDLFNDTDKN